MKRPPFAQARVIRWPLFAGPVSGVFFLWLSVLSLSALCAFAPARAEPLRLAMIGDSLTHGYGLSQGEGLVPQLEAWLRERGYDVAILNAGVSGDTTAGGLARLEWVLADTPDAMIVALGGNDLLRGIDPEATRANLAAILARVQERGVPAFLIGMPAPANFGPDFQQSFAALFPELAAEFGVPLYPDLLAPITKRLLVGEDVSALLQADQIHPNASGVAEIVAVLGPAVARWIDSLIEARLNKENR